MFSGKGKGGRRFNGRMPVAIYALPLEVYVRMSGWLSARMHMSICLCVYVV